MPGRQLLTQLRLWVPLELVDHEALPAVPQQVGVRQPPPVHRDGLDPGGDGEVQVWGVGCGA